MHQIDNPKLFGDRLLAWYATHKRSLPFRDVYNPYYTLVSELMLQQTQMETAVPYFIRFVERYPTVCDLARASIEDVLKLWEGLGYYRRAHHLHEAAKTVCDVYHGTFPKDLALIESLKGVGRYTARAIHSIAFEQPSVAVDGNVLRVMTRVLRYDADVMKEQTRRTIETVLEPVIQHQKPSDFTQAMMELGATICQKKPQCERCPLQAMCEAYAQGDPSAYPVKSVKKDKIRNAVQVFVYAEDDHYLLVQRPDNGLLANLYTFWQDENDFEMAVKNFEQTYGVNVVHHQILTTFNHVFSHVVWEMTVHLISTQHPVRAKLYDLTTFPYAIAKAHLKIREILLK